MRIACIGWGSLIWQPRDLPIILPWKTDGPLLPVEFGRQSKDGRLTLVLAPDAECVPTLWALLKVSNIEEATAALREREGTADKFIGTWPSENALPAIKKFAEKNELSGVVWTSLPPKLGDKNGVMISETDAVEYLSGLEGKARTLAEEYVRNTPKQIATAYRASFEKELGWTPN